MSQEQWFTVWLAVALTLSVTVSIALGRRRRRWSELSAAERRRHKLVLGAGVLTFVAGLVTAVLY